MCWRRNGWQSADGTTTGYPKVPVQRIYQDFLSFARHTPAAVEVWIWDYIKNRIVVKVGTSTLTNELGKPEMRSFDRLACVLADVQNMGYEVILVSSGAIAVGWINCAWRPGREEHALKQAARLLGQCSIMFLYDKFFRNMEKPLPRFF